MLFILGIMSTYMSQRRKLNNALGQPHLLQFIPVLGKPFFNQSLRRQRKIAIGHFKRRQIKHSYAIAVNSVNMRRFMFFRLKEHLHYDAIESCNFWHFTLFLFLVPTPASLATFLHSSTWEIYRPASRRFHPPLSRTRELYQNHRAEIKRGGNARYMCAIIVRKRSFRWQGRGRRAMRRRRSRLRSRCCATHLR